jgi:hypothetical protein
MWVSIRVVLILCLLVVLHCGFLAAQTGNSYDVAIIGAGASGTAAAIQASRSGASVLLVEEGPWVGGMLTAAGVSAIDGNHRLAGGLWGEFRDSLYAHYGGPEAVATGWVSNTLFEPKVGQRILRNMLDREAGVHLLLNSRAEHFRYGDGRWQLTVRTAGNSNPITARILIDATELGDVAAALGVGYDLGMDARAESGEAYAPETGNDIVQDLTYVLTLRDHGAGSDHRIAEPPGYDPDAFRCVCSTRDPAAYDDGPRIDCDKMLAYGRLPNDRYMINWPNCGNDYYLNLVEASPAEREEQLREAKLHSLRFLYFLQTEMGYRNLGLDATYPTPDSLPLLPYHRESRRIHGKVRFDLNHLADPYGQPDPLYRTWVAVGDYPIDHHHKMRPDAPDIDFIKIKAPAYGVPLGVMLPRDRPGLIVAEKSISVSNIVNGATRLQPVVLGIGQAAGAVAAVAVRAEVEPAEVAVRAVQAELLGADAYIQPYIDVPPTDPDFAALQRIGSTGILRSVGVNYKWANQRWLYPERTISGYELLTGLQRFYPELATRNDGDGGPLQKVYLEELLLALGAAELAVTASLNDFPEAHPFTRREVAVLLDHLLDPFNEPIDLHGHRQASPRP